MKKKNQDKIEFSKLLAAFSVLLVIFTFLDFFYINGQIMEGKITEYDFSGFMYAIPSVCTLCTATIVFYYNKAKLENAIKIKYEYVKNLLQLKKKMKLYTNEDLQYQIDNYIEDGEGSAKNEMEMAEQNASQEIDANMPGGTYY